MPLTGHCLCKSVTYAFDATPTWVGYCHCDSCRRNCAAPVAAFMELATEQVRWSGAALASYQSSPGTERRFCPTCGTQMAFQAGHYPGKIHLYVATLADPDLLTPTEHVHFEERICWFETTDDLPRITGSGSYAG